MEVICFDLDNTLILATDAQVRTYVKVFKKNNLKFSKKKLLSLFGIQQRVLLKKLFPKITKKETGRLIKDYSNIFSKDTKKYLRRVPCVNKTLKKLKKRYKLAIASNSKRSNITTTLEQTGIDKKLFNAIVGGESIEHAKPEPDEIFKIEKILHLNAAYMVGDTIYDIMAGKKAKAKTIAVLTGLHSKKMLKKKKPDFIIKSVKELDKVLL